MIPQNLVSHTGSWDLTYIGRIMVIKTLVLPLLVQILTVLPNPPAQVMKEKHIYSTILVTMLHPWCLKFQCSVAICFFF